MKQIPDWALPSSCFMLCLLPAACWVFASLVLRPRKWRRYVPLEARLIFNGLDGDISPKTNFVAKDIDLYDYLEKKQQWT
jgi:hypothetical protein